jgi:hypothetical protein
VEEHFTTITRLPLTHSPISRQIAYWRYALDVAQWWKAQLGQSAPAGWAAVAAGLAPPPRADDGLYTVYEGLNASWWGDSALTGDPRSLVMLRGILPDTAAVDPAVAVRTADRVADVWPDDAIFGWGRPVLAINAAREGNPGRALHHVTAYDYWTFDDAGEFGGRMAVCVEWCVSRCLADVSGWV